MAATYEEMLAFVLAQLTAPIEQHLDEDGVSIITSGEPGEVIVRLTETQVTVAAFSVPLDGTRGAVQPIAVGAVNWTAVSAEAAMRVVKALVSAAREARRATYIECAICERPMPPEWMDAEDVCRDCADTEPGVVH